MAHAILSVKLYELDEKISRLHSRIQLGESEDHNRIRAEVAALRRECEEEALTLRNKLELSKGEVIAGLSMAYSEIEQTIQRAMEGIKNTDAEVNDTEFVSEKKILLAEYTLDFAIQAANRALLAAMEALDAEMNRQEKEEEASV